MVDLETRGIGLRLGMAFIQPGLNKITFILALLLVLIYSSADADEIGACIQKN